MIKPEDVIPYAVMTTDTLEHTLKNYQYYRFKGAFSRAMSIFSKPRSLKRISIAKDIQKDAQDVIRDIVGDMLQMSLDDVEPREEAPAEEREITQEGTEKRTYTKLFTVGMAMKEIFKVLQTLADSNRRICITEADLSDLTGVPRATTNGAIQELVKKRKLAIIKERVSGRWGHSQGRTYLVLDNLDDTEVSQNEEIVLPVDPELEALFKLKDYVESLENQLKEKDVVIKGLRMELERYKSVAGFFSKRLMKEDK